MVSLPLLVVTRAARFDVSIRESAHPCDRLTKAGRFPHPMLRAGSVFGATRMIPDTAAVTVAGSMLQRRKREQGRLSCLPRDAGATGSQAASRF